MSNFRVLADLIGTLTTSMGDARVRAGELRKVGAIGESAKRETTPQVAAVHAASFLFSAIRGVRQADSVEAARDCWHLPPDCVAPFGLPNCKDPTFNPLTFGQRVAELIEQAASDDLETRNALVQLAYIRVQHSVQAAEIALAGPDMQTPGKVHWFRLHSQIAAPNPDALPDIASATTISFSAIRQLGNLVRASRLQAAKLGMTIAVNDACAAMGLIPPSGPGEPPGIVRQLTLWAADTPQEATKAASLPGGTAFAGQSATTLQACHGDTRQGKGTDGRAQQPFRLESQVDGFFTSSRRPPDDNPPHSDYRAAA